MGERFRFIRLNPKGNGLWGLEGLSHMGSFGYFPLKTKRFKEYSMEGLKLPSLFYVPKIPNVP